IINLYGLSQIKSIGGSLKIINNAMLGNLSGLESLTSIGDTLELLNNDAQTNLAGLDQLVYRTISSLRIQDCRMISDCALQNICNYLDLGGWAVISGNATGCNSMTEVQSVCGELPACLVDGV